MQDKYSAFSPKDIAEYISNLYDKLRHKLTLSNDEEQFLEELPDDFVSDADDIKEEEYSNVPAPSEPKVKKVKKKEPGQQNLSPEEVDRLLDKSPEMVVLNSHFPMIFDDDLFFAESNPAHIDASLNTFVYLRDLGYQMGMWVIGPEHKASGCHPTPRSGGMPICDYLNSAMLSLDDLINQAQDYANKHSFYPPKAIIAQSHPGCFCHVVCFKPDTPEAIPDTAPGLPSFGDREELDHYKTQIYERLKTFPVDRFTILSPTIYQGMDTAEAYVVDEADVYTTSPYERDLRYYLKNYGKTYGKYLLNDDRIVFAETTWQENIKPIQVTHSYLFRSSLGPVRPIPDTYVGFQLSKNETHAIIFLGNLSRTVIAPLHCIAEVNLTPVSNNSVDANSFISIDDSLGIAIRVLETGKVESYIPDFDEILEVTPDQVFSVS